MQMVSLTVNNRGFHWDGWCATLQNHGFYLSYRRKSNHAIKEYSVVDVLSGCRYSVLLDSTKYHHYYSSKWTHMSEERLRCQQERLCGWECRRIGRSGDFTQWKACKHATTQIIHLSEIRMP